MWKAEGQESRQPPEQPARNPRDAIAAVTDTALGDFGSNQSENRLPWDVGSLLHSLGSSRYQHHFSSPAPASHHHPRHVLLARVSLVFPGRYYSRRRYT